MVDVTQILTRIGEGDKQASSQLLPLVYAELQRLAQDKLRHERPDHTLQATALVHEAYLRLVGDDAKRAEWETRGHFFAAAAEAMRRILIESIRQKKSLKRGGSHQRIEFDALDVGDPRRDANFLALDRALDRLQAEHPDKADLVKLRFFGGLSRDEAAKALGISTTTATRYWTYARAWLQAEVEDT